MKIKILIIIVFGLVAFSGCTRRYIHESGDTMEGRRWYRDHSYCKMEAYKAHEDKKKIYLDNARKLMRLPV